MIYAVTPYAGVWIEMPYYDYLVSYAMGHSLRGSVDWNQSDGVGEEGVEVTPYAGVWIEMRKGLAKRANTWVTPYAGVWIEINYLIAATGNLRVTPYAGVWIEIREWILEEWE